MHRRKPVELHKTRSTVRVPAFTAALSPLTHVLAERVEILPVKLKVDYKPKRVDYNALRRGKTAELMNFFHFDGSEMTLRHLVVTGVSSDSPRFGCSSD